MTAEIREVENVKIVKHYAGYKFYIAVSIAIGSEETNEAIYKSPLAAYIASEEFIRENSYRMKWWKQ